MGVAGRMWGVATLALLTVACGSDGEDDPDPNPEPPSDCLAPNRLVADGRCVEPGVQDSGCLAGELTLADGSCQPAGIPPEHCGEGFEPAGDGCEPILPAEPCPPGLLALPGETTCREVMPCGDGPWGDIPVEADTVYVDQAYSGSDSDGSIDRPWTTVWDGVLNAPANAIVAVAPGSYPEDVWIASKPVRLWGKCPAEVEVVGQGVDPAAISIVYAGASGTEVHGLAVRGAASGVGSSGAEDVWVDRVWVHDTGYLGIRAETELGPTSMHVSGALVEHSHGSAMLAYGASVDIEDCNVRDAELSTAYHQPGRGINLEEAELVPTATVQHTLVERCQEHGVFAAGVDVTLDELVVLDTRPDPQDQLWGRGIMIQPGLATEAPGNVVLRHALVETSHEVGVAIIGASASIEAIVIRDTQPELAGGLAGRGLVIQESIEHGVAATAEVRAVVVEQSHDAGVVVDGALALLEGTIIRDTVPRVSDQRFGRGLGIQVGSTTSRRAEVIGRGLRIEQNHESGVLVSGSDLQLEGSLIRNTLSGGAGRNAGYGLAVQSTPWSDNLAHVTVETSIVEHNHEAGVTVLESATWLRDMVVRGTLPNPDDELFGDGISAWLHTTSSEVGLDRCLLADNARAGLALFGAIASVSASQLECNTLHLVRETHHDVPATLTDGGGNQCGCGDTTVACQAVSSGLQPPGPLEDLDSGQ